jgi:hypothetical protein
MSKKEPGYWPEADLAALTSEQWQSLKERVIRDAGAERARAAENMLRALFALYRRSAPRLSPAAAPCLSGRSTSPRA